MHSAVQHGSYKHIACDCRYFDPETVGLDFEGMCSDIESAPEGSIIVLHGKLNICAQAYFPNHIYPWQHVSCITTLW